MRAFFFVLFLVSGACSLVYQVIWLRLSMAAFGVTTPMVSIVIATFMAGLALGSWAAGRLARRSVPSAAIPLRFYALAELVIAFSGELVPKGLAIGQRVVSGTPVAAWDPGNYLLSGLCVAAVLLPFCAAMGTTFPLAMWAIRRSRPDPAASSFSFLYLANVLGATVGTLASAFVLIELLGLTRTGLLAAGLNGLLAAAALVASLRAAPVPAEAPEPVAGREEVAASKWLPALLFTTGLASMGMEVVWVRQFTPYLGTVVYAFAIILALYLLATFLGSAAYRRWQGRFGVAAPPAWIWPLLAFAGLLPLVTTDPRWPLPDSLSWGALRVAVGVGPLSALLGFVTPWLLDRWSKGRAERVGGAYALNIVGCILGPLVSGFVLLPWLGERTSLVAFCALLAASAVRTERAVAVAAGARHLRTRWAGATAAGLLIFLLARDFETIFPQREVRRDHAATVIATGVGMRRRLLINGEGMTRLTPITKMMAHLPLASLDRTPRSALIVCFGMGTTFRSMASWDVDITAVELIPSVPELFGFFHADGPALLQRPNARVVVDDGRRFLHRTRQSFDVITIDPPPPVEAAGSSLLYTREFYGLVRPRLAAGGIVQQWLPGGDAVVVTSVTRALAQSFAHVRVFASVEEFGVHYLASDSPIPERTAAELAARLPAEAGRDFTEWGPATTPEGMFAIVLDRELLLPSVMPLPQIPALTDDRPFNEYYLLRQWQARRRAAALANRAPR